MSVRNAALAALVIGAVLFFVFDLRFPNFPPVSVKAEALACVGGFIDDAGHCSKETVFPITNSLLTTVIVNVLLVLVVILGVRNQMVPRGFQNFVELVIGSLHDFAVGVDKKHVAKFFPFVATAFLLIMLSNFIGLVPGVGSIGACEVVTDPARIEKMEANKPKILKTSYDSLPLQCDHDAHEELVPFFRAPTADLNMTVAIALISVILIQYFGLKALGLEYLARFFNFREGPVSTIIGLIELFSEFIRVVSFAFRLFGNIFAGEVVLIVMGYMFPYMLPLPFYAFEVFVSLMQAVIFSVLTLVFMSMATLSHGPGHDEQKATAH
jgi:F-type H+-transporting ATPase subunit a